MDFPPFRKLIVLPLLKDRTLYLALTGSQCVWLTVANQEWQFGHFACDLTMSTWPEALLSAVKQLNMKFNQLEISFGSEQCRFSILPAQTVWPEQDVLEFMATQLLKQQYPDYTADKFRVATSQVSFGQPIIVIAVPVGLYEGLVHLKKLVKVSCALPFLLRIVNAIQQNKQAALKSDFSYTEEKLAFKVDLDGGYPISIETLPTHLVNTASELDLQRMETFDSLISHSDPAAGKIWSSLKQGADSLISPLHVFNLMSLP